MKLMLTRAGLLPLGQRRPRVGSGKALSDKEP